MLSFSVLSSGSRANALYVTDGNTRLLVDCGLSARELERRLANLEVEPSSIDAVLITHEHRDHDSGAQVFCRKHSAPIYANRATIRASDRIQGVSSTLHNEFVTGEEFSIKTFRLQTALVSHDAAEPVAVRVTSGGDSLASVTDLGEMHDGLPEFFENVSALVLESNHDPELLCECPYPWEVKERIRSDRGHLSNQQASTVVRHLSRANRGALRYLVGAHLSERSNHPELVLESFREAWSSGGALSQPEILVGSASVSTALLQL